MVDAEGRGGNSRFELRRDARSRFRTGGMGGTEAQDWARRPAVDSAAFSPTQWSDHAMVGSGELESGRGREC